MGKKAFGPAELNALREAYESGESQRSLARRFGIGKTTVVLWADRYGWERRPEAAAGRDRETLRAEMEKIEAEIAARDSGEFEMLRDTAHQILSKARLKLVREDQTASDLKTLNVMLRDMRALLGVMSPQEAAERELRLAVLKKQAERLEDGDRCVEVRFVNTEGCEM